jgi:Putative beta-barrel porin 2
VKSCRVGCKDQNRMQKIPIPEQHLRPSPRSRTRQPQIRSACNNAMEKRAFSLFGLILCLVWGILPHSSLHAGEPTVEVINEDNPLPVSEGAEWRPFPRVEIFTDFHTGYDDNFRTDQGGGGAWFTSEMVTLSYRLPSQTTELSLIAGGGVVDYWGKRTDGNGSLDLLFSRNLTRRLSLNASLDVRYQVEPDFATNTGPNGFRGSYFSTRDRFWASYSWTPRFATVSSYNLTLIRYDNAATAAFTDREEHTFGEQLRFTLTRTTVLTGEYRFLLVDYVTAPLDSTTHFLLAGVEHRFSPRLSAELRAGASIRSFDVGGSQTNPNFESSLKYALSDDTSLDWTTSYSVEQPQQRGVVTQKTFRTGLRLNHDFTGRISATLSVNYNHDNDQQGTSLQNPGQDFSQDVFSLALRGRYQFNRRLAFDTEYNHSQVNSSRAVSTVQDYARNRYSIGFSYTF